MEYPDYIGLSDETKMVVQKENRLVSLASSKLNLNEFKILDAFLSRIDSHFPDKNRVRFENGDLERILNKKRIRFDRLQESIQGLFDDIKIIDETKPDGFVIISLFTRTDAFRDDDGIWHLDLECTDVAKEYFFNVEKFGYIKYMLSNISCLSSRTTYLMYLMLEGERNLAANYRKGESVTFKKSLDDLKVYLGCENNSSYETFKYFNFHVLKKCCKEINEKTSLKYEYKPVDKRGYHYKNIEFTVSVPKPAAAPIKAVEIKKKETGQGSAAIDYRAVIMDVFEDIDLTMKQVKALNTLLGTTSLSADEAEKILKNALWKYTDQSAKQDIEDPYAYLSAIIKNDMGAESEAKAFKDMTEEERKADFDRRLAEMIGR